MLDRDLATLYEVTLLLRNRAYPCYQVCYAASVRGQHRNHARLREAASALASNAEHSRRLDELESKYDRRFKVVFDVIRQLMAPPVHGRKEIGVSFAVDKKIPLKRSPTCQYTCGTGGFIVSDDGVGYDS